MASKETVEFIDRCSNCNSTSIRTDYVKGEIVCNVCGLVLCEDIIDLRPTGGPEPTDNGAGHGDPITGTNGITTTIGKNGKGVKDIRGMRNIRNWHRRTAVRNGTQRSMARAEPKIEQVATMMGLNSAIVGEAKLIYKKAIMKHLIRGRSIDCVVAVSLYIACRKLQVSRTLDEFSEATGIGRTNIGRTYRFIAKNLRVRINPTRPEEYTQRFCSRLKVSGNVCCKSQEIIRKATELELTSGKGPTGITAASIYIASILCHEHRTQRDIAEASGVTEVTIRNRYRELTQRLNIEIAA